MDMVSTGKVIALYLEENGLSAIDLAESSNVSLRTIIRVLKDDSKLPTKVAFGLNSLIPEISVDFIMSYDIKYQLQKLSVAKDNHGINIDQCVKEYKIDKLFKLSHLDKLTMFDICKSIFGIGNISNNYSIDLNKMDFCFSLAKNDQERPKLIWLKTSYEEYQMICDNNPLVFNRDIFVKSFKLIKRISKTSSIDATLFNMKEFCKNCGINFYFRPSIPNARVKAVTVRDNRGYIYIFVSDLFKCIENLWLAFVHECMHIENNDFDKVKMIKDGSLVDIDEDYIEEEAISFFVGDNMIENKKYTMTDISSVSNSTNSCISIVAEIARFRSGIYGDKDINSFIHYYKSTDIDFISPFVG